MSKKVWTIEEADALFKKPLFELLFEAQQVHRQHFDPTKIQVSRLLSIKTGRCSEDCKYCSQSVHHDTGLEAEKLMEVQKVIEAAKKAKEDGASRFCMGAAWRNPKPRDMPYIKKMIEEVKGLGMETCMTLGQLTAEQANELANTGLDYYNHNLDTSPEFYGEIVTTHNYQNRLDTLDHVRNSGMKICSGGIIGLGESQKDRASLLVQLANMLTPPESVPINRLIPIQGTPLGGNDPVDDFDFVRTIAVARIMMPKSMVRLSAGRESMSSELQALCFMAGANSIFYGAKLLTSPNADEDVDNALFERLNLTPAESPMIDAC
ncbi:biotin synthase BioB [Wohlfahrtiimonas chitiniclastica]|uniref:Biotin synthase n=2 Tax=Wohlfahrtiimonas chitiniclastica TaxID=400946 RepID=L8XUR9_9GAMM|nr:MULTISPECIES: biotin synthase BioB [Wohlfahrtiimonas]ELV07793.1 Biotin synthase [Wohlfahrtiimonas chitiniclastica SH04]KZS23416.1 biotin synthase BioB [Wohlfahrtiimonas chitiniclastica]MBS7815324.1 biotin synthase BioB [Wohlfahrtiimonas chitiniclastica]MBS7817508.1 biotin synthase BioB [Wohlfahrtiimonas chitiniclastica]MBS7819334.1 biotin synthase BioB [Wohlfahrtiimonas chitiniclastica]